MKTILALVALLGTVTLAAMQSPPSGPGQLDRGSGRVDRRGARHRRRCAGARRPVSGGGRQRGEGLGRRTRRDRGVQARHGAEYADGRGHRTRDRPQRHRRGIGPRARDARSDELSDHRTGHLRTVAAAVHLPDGEFKLPDGTTLGPPPTRTAPRGPSCSTSTCRPESRPTSSSRSSRCRARRRCRPTSRRPRRPAAPRSTSSSASRPAR